MTWILLIGSFILLGLGVNIQYKRNVGFLINDEYKYTEEQCRELAEIVGFRVVILSMLLSCTAVCSLINYLLFAPFAFIFIALLIMLIERVNEFNRKIEEDSRKEMIRIKVNNRNKL